MKGFLAFKTGKRGICAVLLLLLALSYVPSTSAVGKDDLQVTIDMKKKVLPGESGTLTVNYKNVGKYKISVMDARLSSTALDLDEKIFSFDLASGEEKVTTVGFKVKPERKGKSFFFINLIFCEEIPSGIPPCPGFMTRMQAEFEIEEAPPPTTAPPVITEKKFEASIVSPSPGSVFTPEDAIDFSARSSSGNQVFYVWESNIDGLIGQTERFSRTLSEGTHTIRLTAKSGSKTAEATVQILVTKAESPQTTIPPQTQTPAPQTGGSRLKTLLIFLGALAFLTLVALGIVLLLPKKKKGRKRKMGKHTMNICPSCGRNNASNARRCWKCKAPLR